MYPVRWWTHRCQGNGRRWSRQRLPLPGERLASASRLLSRRRRTILEGEIHVITPRREGHAGQTGMFPGTGPNGRVRVLSVIGTRPEAIKMAPVVRELEDDPERFESRVC